MNRNSKPGWEIQLEAQTKNLRQQAKMIRPEEHRNMLGRKEKSNPISKTNNVTRGNKPSACERRMTKKISRQDKKYRQNRTFQNNEIKIYLQVRGECTTHTNNWIIKKDLRCPWCNGYRRRYWTRRHEFKSWTDCISHSSNTLGKGMNRIILPQLWVNSRAD